MRAPLGPGAVEGTNRELTGAPLLLECINQPAAADGAGTGSPFCQLVGEPLGPTTSKLGFCAKFPLKKNMGGHEEAAGEAACTLAAHNPNMTDSPKDFRTLQVFMQISFEGFIFRIVYGFSQPSAFSKNEKMS